MRLKLTMEYDGSSFRGWARQPGERTVEGELRRALERRTRAHVDGHDVPEGVHAGVGAAGDGDVGAIAVHHVERLREHALHRPLAGLPRPPSEGGSVVGDRKLQPHPRTITCL